MTTSYKRISVFAALLGLLSCSEPDAAVATDSSESRQFERLKLPRALREVSGLAIAPSGRLFAIADENGAVYEISLSEGTVDVVPGFGNPPVKEDFEGITVKGDWLYATTSEGKLYRRALSNSDPDEFDKFKTKLGERCEIEGLAAHPTSENVWFLCKTPYKKKYKNKLVLFAWSPTEFERAPDLDIEVPYSRLGFKKSISPSGVSFSTRGNELFIVAAKEQAFVVIDKDGKWIRGGRLPDRKYHPQTEGIAIFESSIYLADEGRDGKGAVTHYPNGF